MMARTIVLPLDGTATSERAVAFTQVLAKHLPARVVLVRSVLLSPFSHEPGSTPQPEVQEACEELRLIAGRLRRAGVDVEWFVINDEAGWAIITAASEQGADFIVMATHGRGTLGRLFIGSVADRVVRDGPTPVLLVPPMASFNWPPPPHQLRIVVATDGSPLATQAVAPAFDLALATGGEIILTWAMEPPLVTIEEELVSTPTKRVTVNEMLPPAMTTTAERLQGQGVTTTTAVMVGRPADVISELALAKGAHLIAMATHGRQGVPRLVLGSVAQGVLNQTRVPLLLCGPHATRARGFDVTRAPDFMPGATAEAEAGGLAR